VFPSEENFKLTEEKVCQELGNSLDALGVAFYNKEEHRFFVLVSTQGTIGLNIKWDKEVKEAEEIVRE